MPQLLNRVQPGDLITAAMWNDAVDAINQLLLSRPVSSVTISATSPRGTSDDPIRTGATLQIVGQNFGYTSARTKVTFEGPFGVVEVLHGQLLAGSSDTRLLLIVPPIPAIGEAGMTVTLRVDSGVGHDTRTVLVRPVVIPLNGDIFVTWRGDPTLTNPSPNPLQPSQQAEFALNLATGINLPATFTLTADIRNPTAALPAGFVAGIEFLRENRTVITSKTVDMGTNDSRNIIVRTPALPSTFGNQSFTLEVRATAGGVTNTFSRTFTVGAVVQPPDPNIQPQRTGALVLDAAGAPVNDPARGELAGTTIKLRAGHTMLVMYNLRLTGATANYNISILPKQGTTLTGWSPQLANTPATVPGPDNSRLVQFMVTPASAATTSPNGTVVFRIQRTGNTSDWFEEFNVELLP